MNDNMDNRPEVNDEEGLSEVFDEEELDLVTFVDDEGNETVLEVRDYFYYNGDEFAVLVDFDDGEGDEDEPVELNAYIMKVNPVGEDEEEFVPVEDDDLYQELLEIAQTRFDDMEDEEFVDAEDPDENN